MDIIVFLVSGIILNMYLLFGYMKLSSIDNDLYYYLYFENDEMGRIDELKRKDKKTVQMTVMIMLIPFISIPFFIFLFILKGINFISNFRN